MTTGGDWKELVRAASAGDDKTVQYLLTFVGVDPNYQHPEYMTTPLLEAIRYKHYTTVCILLSPSGLNNDVTSTATPTTTTTTATSSNNNCNNKKSGVTVIAADPTVAGDLDGQSPIELALELKDHDMVDLLLPFLTTNNNHPRQDSCKTIIITGPKYQYDLIKYILHLGHCVIVVVSHTDDTDDDDNKNNSKVNDTEVVCNCKVINTKEEEIKLRKETGNKKIYFLPKHPSKIQDFFNQNSDAAAAPKTFLPYSYVPTFIDIWIHTVTATSTTTSEIFLQDFASHIPPVKYFSSTISKKDISSQQQQEQPDQPISCLLILESNYDKLNSNVTEQLLWLFSKANQSLIIIFATIVNQPITSYRITIWNWFVTSIFSLFQYMKTISYSSWSAPSLSSSSLSLSLSHCTTISHLLGLVQPCNTIDNFFLAKTTTDNVLSQLGVHGRVYFNNDNNQATIPFVILSNNTCEDINQSNPVYDECKVRPDNQPNTYDNDWIQQLESIF